MNKITWRLYAFTALGGLLCLAIAYFCQGISVPYRNEAGYFAVYVALGLESLAAGNAKRRNWMLWLTLLCGVVYFYALLGIFSPASIFSSGFVVASALLAIAAQTIEKEETVSFEGNWKQKLVTAFFLLQRNIGTWWRMLIIFPISLYIADIIVTYYPYQMLSETDASIGIMIGFIATLLIHSPLALYDWGKMQPGSKNFRRLSIIGASINLFYYLAFNLPFSVFFNAALLIDNLLNIIADRILRLLEDDDA